jgi:putative addiction module component (TIGR02574 family)
MGRFYLPHMILETLPDLGRMTPAQKLVLVTELWDDLAAHPAEVPVSPSQIAELDQRMADYRRDPTQITTWEAIQHRILGRTLASE